MMHLFLGLALAGQPTLPMPGAPRGEVGHLILEGLESTEMGTWRGGPAEQSFLRRIEPILSTPLATRLGYPVTLREGLRPEFRQGLNRFRGAGSPSKDELQGLVAGQTHLRVKVEIAFNEHPVGILVHEQVLQATVYVVVVVFDHQGKSQRKWKGSALTEGMFAGRHAARAKFLDAATFERAFQAALQTLE